MRTTRVLPIALASVLALAATGCGATEFKKDAPQTAVRDFLSEALATQNGQRACDYMTQEAQTALAGTDQSGQTCRASLERASLVSDGKQVDTTSGVKDLGFSSTTNGNDATVTVTTKKGPTLTLKLQHDDGLGNLYEPKTPWRIVGGATPLISGS